MFKKKGMVKKKKTLTEDKEGGGKQEVIEMNEEEKRNKMDKRRITRKLQMTLIHQLAIGYKRRKKNETGFLKTFLKISIYITI